MSLTAKEVAEISRLLEESHFDILELEIDGLKLSLRRAGAAQTADASPASTRVAAPVTPPAAPAAAATRAGATAATVPRTPAPDDPDQHRVTAPFLGTFYRSPKPGAPPFVAEGAAVEPDTVIGIIEVMKLMNSVPAGVAGKVARILASDGALVEYGETLLLVSRAG